MSDGISFMPLSTFIDPSFWNELNRKKLNEWKLDETPQPIFASYCNFDQPSSTSRLSLSFDAFSDEDSLSRSIGINYVKGRVHLLNTDVAFKKLDRRAVLLQCGDKVCYLSVSMISSQIMSIKKLITDGFENEGSDMFSSLTTFHLTIFAWLHHNKCSFIQDLKHYHYWFWNCQPALLYPHKLKLLGAIVPVNEEKQAELRSFSILFNGLPFVLFDETDEVVGDIGPVSMQQFFGISKSNRLKSASVKIVFLDPSTHPQVPGWPLRNILAAIAYHFREWRDAHFIAYRANPKLPSINLNIGWSRLDSDEDFLSAEPIGWERSERGTLEPVFVDMSSTFDPIKIVDEGVRLNLSLIRWRLVPEIKLERFSALRCLMLGSGTLGCNVARLLLGWGVKRIVFVDNANVSFSNPVRQSLFEFDDAIGGGKSKALAASEKLHRIVPSVDTDYVDMKIPMPGHSVAEKDMEKVRESVTKLEGLIKQSDVVFLVMDSREARWLPTLLSRIHGKLTISVAMGFDSYVVIRHGLSIPVDRSAAETISCEDIFESGDSTDTESSSKLLSGMNASRRAGDQSSAAYDESYEKAFTADDLVIPGSELGCYFCSDVTAPGNSILDRTLDQQCTVSRAGVSMIAAGMAVELLASVLQHPKLGLAPARIGEIDDNSSALGATPHQIRGFLSRFHQMTPTVRRFDRCVACGEAVVNAYREQQTDFILKVLNEPKHLETISGLEQLQASTEQMRIEFDDDDLSSSSVQYLTKHCQRVHSSKRDANVDSSNGTTVEQSNNGALSCSMCSKSFLYLSQLCRHQLSHLNVREHECAHCWAKFVQKSHLEMHIARKHAAVAEAGNRRVDAERTTTIASTLTVSSSSSSSSDDCDSASDITHPDNQETVVAIQRSSYKTTTDSEEASTSHPNKSNNLTEALSTTVVPGQPRILCIFYNLFMSRNHTKWKCWKCGQQFVSKSLFYEHMDRHDPSRIHQCTICQRRYDRWFYSIARFRGATELKTHEQSHSGRGTFLCVRCNAIFIQRTQLERHIARVHNSRRQCLSCAENFSSIAQYCSHMRIIHAMITCAYCGAEMESDSKRHRELFHWRRLPKPRAQTTVHVSHFTQSSDCSANNNEQEQKAMLMLIVLLDDHQTAVGDDGSIDVHKGFPPGLVQAFPALANLQIRVTDFAIEEALKSIVLSFPIEADVEHDPQMADFIHTPIFIDFRDN
ncbi:unnamed protein product [Anisakis simplex]|uniref:Ubiquitin-like modifier-activating enzyme ATG7 (inferred by orthology to a human protein) n=1 Tax=Anisakis simplex TaxID=6269 RepID=A0A0M3JVD4_ANISI|nr:unnamed protein product [Anisakis simplex]